MKQFFLFRNFLSLLLKAKLIFVLLSIYIFCTSNANYLSLNNGDISCVDRSCYFEIKDNSKLKFSKDNRVLELVSENIHGEDELISYLFYTTDIVGVVAYSGKPLEILISLKLNGVIDDLKLVKHSEPILLTGIPIEKLLEAVCFYKGKNINNRLAIGEDVDGVVSVPIIAGATVTSLILHETILESSRDVGSIFGFVDSSILDGALNNKFKKYSWNELVKNKAIKHYILDAFMQDESKADFDNLLVDIYFADLLHPSIGKNLLGEKNYEDLFNDLNGHSAILILNNGTWSFKGSGFVRGGIFDRFRIEQDGNIFTFRDNDFKNLYELDLIDVDDFREVGVFVVNSVKYKPWKSWNLILLLNYKTFSIEYKMPDVFCVTTKYPWLDHWKSKIFNTTLLLSLWFFVILIFSLRSLIAKSNFYLSMIYNCVLLLDIYIIGFLLHGQPSVVNIFALKEIKTFLWDPYLCVGWIMIFSTILFWGKSIFCGWICPFGALQEIFFKIRSLIYNDISIEFSNNLLDKLKYLRYLILFVLILTAFYKGVAYAELLSEIEPFKTAWSVGLLNRAWYISFYTIFLLMVSVFTYRFFCRFICPLGAFLSLLSIFTIFRINRRGACGSCHICEIKCNSKAIRMSGKIDVKECFGCFTCINNMYNKKICPPLISKKVWDKYEIGKWEN